MTSHLEPAPEHEDFKVTLKFRLRLEDADLLEDPHKGAYKLLSSAFSVAGLDVESSGLELDLERVEGTRFGKA